MPKKKVEPEKRKRAEKILPEGVKDGRPPREFTVELANDICETIATSGHSIKTLCKMNKHWPGHKVLFGWISKHEHFRDQYAIAKRRQAEFLADEIIDICNNVTNTEEAACGRLQIDTRKWIASKMIPKVYGNQYVIEELKGQNDEMMRELLELRAQLNEKNKKEY